MKAKFLICSVLSAISMTSYADSVAIVDEQSQEPTGYVRHTLKEIPCALLVPRFFFFRDSAENQDRIEQYRASYNRRDCEERTGISFSDALATNQNEAIELQQLREPHGN